MNFAVSMTVTQANVFKGSFTVVQLMGSGVQLLTDAESTPRCLGILWILFEKRHIYEIQSNPIVPIVYF